MNILIYLLAFLFEYIDSSLGMMYGTALVPLLILMGYDITAVVPSILISQALGGAMATLQHHRLGNAVLLKASKDVNFAKIIIICGFLATFIGFFMSVKLPAILINSYLAVLIISIGILILAKITFVMTTTKVIVLGALSAFNKVLTGGGYGPLVAGGQTLLKGRKVKAAIATTDFAEVPICLLGFICWVVFKGLPDLTLAVSLICGAIVGGTLGPTTLSTAKSQTRIKTIMAIVILLEGFCILWKMWG